MIYQILHPWHWLTYGNNASGVASVCAVLGLIGLALYVCYTKAIMDATLSSYQASFFPVLTATLSDTSQFFIHWRLRNLGRGPARNIRVWRIEEGNDAPSLFKRRQYLPDERAWHCGTLLPDHDEAEAFEIHYEYASGEDAFLVVIDAEDNAGNSHQLQILSYGKGSRLGRLYHEVYAVPVERHPGRKARRRNSRRFVHGRGTNVGVDLNRTNIDGTPYVPPRGLREKGER